MTCSCFHQQQQQQHCAPTNTKSLPPWKRNLAIGLGGLFIYFLLVVFSTSSSSYHEVASPSRSSMSSASASSFQPSYNRAMMAQSTMQKRSQRHHRRQRVADMNDVDEDSSSTEISMMKSSREASGGQQLQNQKIAMNDVNTPFKKATIKRSASVSTGVEAEDFYNVVNYVRSLIDEDLRKGNNNNNVFYGKSQILNENLIQQTNAEESQKRFNPNQLEDNSYLDKTSSLSAPSPLSSSVLSPVPHLSSASASSSSSQSLLRAYSQSYDNNLMQEMSYRRGPNNNSAEVEEGSRFIKTVFVPKIKKNDKISSKNGGDHHHKNNKRRAIVKSWRQQQREDFDIFWEYQLPKKQRLQNGKQVASAQRGDHYHAEIAVQEHLFDALVERLKNIEIPIEEDVVTIVAGVDGMKTKQKVMVHRRRVIKPFVEGVNIRREKVQGAATSNRRQININLAKSRIRRLEELYNKSTTQNFPLHERINLLNKIAEEEKIRGSEEYQVDQIDELVGLPVVVFDLKPYFTTEYRYIKKVWFGDEEDEDDVRRRQDGRGLVDFVAEIVLWVCTAILIVAIIGMLKNLVMSSSSSSDDTTININKKKTVHTIVPDEKEGEHLDFKIV